MARPQREKATIDPLVTAIAAGIAVLFVLTGALFPDRMATVGEAAWQWIARWFGWVYVMATFGFVAFMLFLGLSRFGGIRLSEEDGDEEPEFSTFSWISMMFAVGVGIGLIFYGATEPVLLWANPPPGTAEPQTQDAAITGMEYSLLHWCLHVWAFFGVVGLALAYLTYRKGRKTLVSEAFVPLFGERASAEHWAGRAINILVIFATLFGNAVTLGLGVLQITSGISYIGGPESTLTTQAIITAVLTCAFVLSAITGVARGVQVLANINVGLAVALVIFLLVVGPLAFILALLPEALGGYLFNFVPMSFQTGAFGGDEWMRSWTIFFWAWGISWAPYVGTFLARVSRGRTIREYVLGVLIVPSAVTVLWFAVLGGTALHLQITGRRDIAAVAAGSPEAGLFEVLGAYPFALVTSGVVIVLAAIFFVAGADAGAIVLGTFSSRGSLHPHRWLTAVWGSLIGLVAIVLLLVGGLEALQWGAIVVASPFALVLIGMCVGLYRDILSDPAVRGRPIRMERGDAPPSDIRQWVERFVQRAVGPR
ncbi:choline/carnitine/betaine transport [Spinactinospora alkalitolerans]|uniref:Choline/carnitine/betaine transport n=1 Tax=Spinactinospora alkalitolerans TaxID=687207 RepID=A0A852TWI2_9ACTN|nr:BCCT family transporter [Spinactinospora alkalitolerans]NYE48876.1 choline/carnitine/betaine transport [Spinactinospora alkalitolerans]